MTGLTVPVTISAIDNLTGGLASMAGKIGAIGQQFNLAARHAAVFGIQTANALAGPAKSLAFFAAGQQGELDKQLRMFQAFGDATEAQRKRLREIVNEIAPKIGMSHKEMLEGATEFAQAGLAPADILSRNDKGILFLERLGKAAVGANEKIGDLAVGLAQLAYIGKFPYGTSAEKAGSLEMLAGIALAAPNFGPDRPKGHILALAQFAPLLVPMMTGANPTPEESYKAMLQASALQSTLSFAFREQLGGMGLKTIFQRIMNPTEAAQQQMMLGEFNYARVFGGLDSGWARNGDALIKSLLAGGVDASGARATIQQRLNQRTDADDILQFKGKLVAELGDELGLKKGNSRDRGILKRGVDNFFAMAQGKFDLLAFLEELTKMKPAQLKDLAGLHHAPKAAILQGQQAISEYLRIFKEMGLRAPLAVDTMSGVRNDPKSWDFQLRRFDASLQTLKNAFWDSGTGQTFVAVLDAVNEKIGALSRTDTAKLQLISAGLIGIGASTAALAGLGFVLPPIVAALTMLATALSTPIVGGTVGALIMGKGEMSRKEEMIDWAKRADAARAAGEGVPDLPASAMPLIPRLWNWLTGPGKQGGVPGTVQGGPIEQIEGSRFGPRPGLMDAARALEVPPAGEIIVRIEQDGRATLQLIDNGRVHLKAGASMTDTGR